MTKKFLIGVFVPIFIVGFSVFVFFPQTAEASWLSDIWDDVTDGLSEGWAAPFAGDVFIDCWLGWFGFCDGQQNGQDQPPASIESCDSCGSCGDSRYRWCTGGQYGSGQCVEFTCDCRPDLCDGGAGGPGGGPGGGAPVAPSVDLKVNGVDSLGISLEVPALFTLSWSSANAASCSASGSWNGGRPLSGSEGFTDIQRGFYSYTISCSGPGGSASDSISFQVVEIPKCSFGADPKNVIRPQPTTLSWQCFYATSCSIDKGVGTVNPVSGSAQVSPRSSVSYVLTCGSIDDAWRTFTANVSVFIPGLIEVLPRR